MSEVFANVAQWPIWNFFSVVLVVFLTQYVIASRERRKSITETRLQLYLNTIAPLCDLYQAALAPNAQSDTTKLHRDIFELAARYSIMGSDSVMDAYCSYSEFVMSHIEKDTPAEERALRQLATNVTYAMCCDIHNEKFCKTEPDQRI